MKLRMDDGVRGLHVRFVAAGVSTSMALTHTPEYFCWRLDTSAGTATSSNQHAVGLGFARSQHRSQIYRSMSHSRRPVIHLAYGARERIVPISLIALAVHLWFRCVSFGASPFRADIFLHFYCTTYRQGRVGGRGKHRVGSMFSSPYIAFLLRRGTDCYFYREKCPVHWFLSLGNGRVHLTLCELSLCFVCLGFRNWKRFF